MEARRIDLAGLHMKTRKPTFGVLKFLHAAPPFTARLAGVGLHRAQSGKDVGIHSVSTDGVLRELRTPRPVPANHKAGHSRTTSRGRKPESRDQFFNTPLDTPRRVNPMLSEGVGNLHDSKVGNIMTLDTPPHLCGESGHGHVIACLPRKKMVACPLSPVKSKDAMPSRQPIYRTLLVATIVPAAITRVSHTTQMRRVEAASNNTSATNAALGSRIDVSPRLLIAYHTNFNRSLQSSQRNSLIGCILTRP